MHFSSTLRSHREPRSRRSALWVFLALWLAVFGCEEEPTAPTPPPPPTNSDQPNANALVTAHRIAGDPSKATSYWDLMDMEDGTFLVSGIQDGRAFAARLQADGTPLWTRFTDYYVAEAHVLTLPGGHGVVVVGTRDANADGFDDRSVVALYDAGGGLLNEIELGAAGEDIGLNDVEVLTEAADSELIVVGYTGTDLANLPFRPLAMRIDVQGDGSLVLRQQQSYPDLTYCSFRDAESDAVTSPAVFVSGNVYDAAGASVRAILGRLSDSLQVEWAHGLVVAPDHRTAVQAGSLQVANGVLYVVGASEVDKQTPPANGGHWDGGVAAAISPAGQLQWLQLVSLTGHGESLAESRVDGPYLYAAGWCARYQFGTDGECFSYGLLTKIDRNDGTVLSNMSFGDPDFASGFNSLVVHGNRAVCVGWTNDYYANDGCFQAWFTDIAVGGPTAPQREAAATGIPASALVATVTTNARAAVPAWPEARVSRP